MTWPSSSCRTWERVGRYIEALVKVFQGESTVIGTLFGQELVLNWSGVHECTMGLAPRARSTLTNRDQIPNEAAIVIATKRSSHPHRRALQAPPDTPFCAPNLMAVKAVESAPNGGYLKRFEHYAW